jgi:hypothetical protein
MLVKRNNSSHCRAWNVKLIHLAEYLANANNDLRWHLSALVLSDANCLVLSIPQIFLLISVYFQMYSWTRFARLLTFFTKKK